MKYNILFLCVLSFFAACQSEKVLTPPGEAAQIAEGLAIVQANCASCHAIGVTGESPRNDAPPLRKVLANYNVESLADDFREHIHVGHADMPDFDFGPKGTDEVIAYLKSIQDNPQD